MGTVPSYCRPDGWSATHPYCFNGALARTVEDSATMLNRMAYYNPRDPISLPVNANKDFTELMKASVEGKRIAFTYDFDLWDTDDDIKTTVLNAARKFEDAGACVDIVHFDFKHTLDEIIYCWAWSISIDTAIDLELWKNTGLDLIKDYREMLPDNFIYFNEIAKKADIFDMRVFNEIRTDILDNFEDVFSCYDVNISPTTECPPAYTDDAVKFSKTGGVPLSDASLDFIKFAETPLANFIGYPAASVPAGFTPDNLPVGMQIIGKQYHDEDVLAFSYTFEQLQPWDYTLALERPDPGKRY